MILYAVLCRTKDATVLVECSVESVSGNISQAYFTLIQYLRDHPSQVRPGERKTFVQRSQRKEAIQGSQATHDDYDFWNILESCHVPRCGELSEEGLDYFFHVYNDGNVYCCCLSDDPDVKEQNVSFAFLEHVKSEFSKKYFTSKIDNAKVLGFNKAFSPNVRSAMHHYNINHVAFSQEEKIRTLSTQVADLKSVIGVNLTLLISRGENLDLLVNKSEQMQQDTMVFRKKTDKMRRGLENKSYGMIALLVLSVLLLVYFIGASACGVTFSKCVESGR